MSYLAIIRKTFSCSRWEQIQRPTLSQCAESERLGRTLSPIGMSPSTPLPLQGSGMSVEEEMERCWGNKAQQDRHTYELIGTVAAITGPAWV